MTQGCTYRAVQLSGSTSGYGSARGFVSCKSCSLESKPRGDTRRFKHPARHSTSGFWHKARVSYGRGVRAPWGTMMVPAIGRTQTSERECTPTTEGRHEHLADEACGAFQAKHRHGQAQWGKSLAVLQPPARPTDVGPQRHRREAKGLDDAAFLHALRAVRMPPLPRPAPGHAKRDRCPR